VILNIDINQYKHNVIYYIILVFEFVFVFVFIMSEHTDQQYAAIIQRFPTAAKLSYETVAHKKVSPETHPIGILIPQARKCFVWFTYDSSADICLLMELNRDQKFSAIHPVPTAKTQLSLGTVLYGSHIESISNDPSSKHLGTFIIEDICLFKGITLEKQTFSKKLGFIHAVLRDVCSPVLRFAMPVFFENTPHNGDGITTDLYPIHHIQYRPLTVVAPFYNVFLDQHGRTNLGDSVVEPVSAPVYRVSLREQAHFGLPQYKTITTFRVCADIQNDIYHLYATNNTSNVGKIVVSGDNNSYVYYDVAYIPNYNVSVYMNAIFRRIRENQNLDNVEESDDEEDFQDMREDKYVDLDKVVYMECAFHTKFRRWVPIGIAKDATKVVVAINRLIQNQR